MEKTPVSEVPAAEAPEAQGSGYDDLGKEVAFDKYLANIRKDTSAEEKAEEKTEKAEVTAEKKAEELEDTALDSAKVPGWSDVMSTLNAMNMPTGDLADVVVQPGEEEATQGSDGKEQLNAALEKMAANAEKMVDEAERKIEPIQEIQESEKTGDNHDKTKTERKLDAAKERLSNLNQMLEDANASKEQAEKAIEETENLLIENEAHHNELSNKMEDLKAEIKKTKRNLVTHAANFLRVMKNLAFGRHDKAREIMNKMASNLERNEAATNERETVKAELTDVDDKRQDLLEQQKGAVADWEASNTQISRLEKQKIELEKQVGRLSEEAAIETRMRQWKDAREGILAEEGARNIVQLRADFDKKEREIKKAHAAELKSLEPFKGPASVAFINLLLARHGIETDGNEDNSEIFAKIEGDITEKYSRQLQEIDLKRAKVDEYFPTWQERIQKLKADKLIKGALDSVKRKALIAIYDLGAGREAAPAAA